MIFEQEIIKRAKENPKKIVFPEGTEDRILKAANKMIEEKIAIPILLGDEKVIKKRIELLKLNLENMQIIDPNSFEKFDEYANTLFELRKHKGLTLEQAKEILKDENYFGIMMVKKGDADGMVSGSVHTSADTMRPALQIIKTREGAKFVSGAFFMVKENKILLFADIALIPEPTPEQLADIAVQSTHTYEYFTNKKAKVAMLSYSTHGSAKSETIERVRQAVEIVKKTHPWIEIDGEIQADAALVQRVAEFKCPDSLIKGKANVLVFPNLDAGNIGAKLVEHLDGWHAVGPLLQGLAKPVSDLSRGSTVEEIITTTACVVVECQRGSV